jgi:ribosome-binding protein aMBF1 (putative translation factor)
VTSLSYVDVVDRDLDQISTWSPEDGDDLRVSITMTTNRTTRSPKESVPSTSDSNCQFGTSAASAPGASTPAIPGATASPKSRRQGTKSFSAGVSAREATDEAFAARMAAARARIAPDLYDVPLTLGALRLSRGLSQAALATRLGTSQSHVAKIESGKLNIQFETAAALADALDVSLDALRPMISRVPRKTA